MARQDLGKIVSEVTSVNVTVDNNVGVPSAEASISGTLTEKELSINFKNLKGEKGDKPTKGTDYYTDQEKQEFITETNALVVAEGKKQVKELQNQSSLSIERLLKIQKEIEAILQNQEAIGNALALNGKSGPQYDKEIRSIAGGDFDTALLYLNDAGTKYVNKIYFDRNKSGVFKCIQTTTSTVNSTTNFVDVSSLENANKLENLCIKSIRINVEDNDDTQILEIINRELSKNPQELEVILFNVRGATSIQRNIELDTRKLIYNQEHRISFFIVNSKISLNISNIELKTYINACVSIKYYGETVTIKSIVDTIKRFQILCGNNYTISNTQNI